MRFRRAFTLIELMIVTAVMMVLSVVLYNLYKRNMVYDKAEEIYNYAKTIDFNLFVIQTFFINLSRYFYVEGGLLYPIVSSSSPLSVLGLLKNADETKRAYHSLASAIFEDADEANKFRSFIDRVPTGGLPIKNPSNIEIRFATMPWVPHYQITTKSGRRVFLGNLVLLHAIEFDMSNVSPDIREQIANALRVKNSSLFEYDANRRLIRFYLNAGTGYGLILRP